MNDPSQHDRAIANSETLRLEAKMRKQIQEGATSLELKNNKWDVEYEGKDAKGQIERAFQAGWGDSRKLPEKMVGETTRQAVARSMGRGLIEGGITRNKSTSIDGTDDPWKPEDDEMLRKLKKEAMEANAPPAIKTQKKTAAKSAEQQKRLENQWAVGLTGGSYGMHTRHVTTSPPAFRSQREAKVPPPAPVRGVSPEKGPPSPTGGKSSYKKMPHVSPKEQSYSRRRPRSSNKTAPPPAYEVDKIVDDRPEVFDRKGPNVVSGPVPRDGFVTDSYTQHAYNRLEEIEGESLGLSLVDGRLMYESATKDEEIEGMKLW